MKKLIAVISIIVILTGCATMGSQSNDKDYTSKNLYVTERSVSQNWWDIFKMGVGVGLDVIGKAILLNNFMP